MLTPIYLVPKDDIPVDKTINDLNKAKWDETERVVDKWTFIGSLTFIITFNLVYWFRYIKVTAKLNF